jgi:nitrate/TMAO reductase-like tetraheme cytochrome c subunit
MIEANRRWTAGALLLLVALVFSACDTQIVYRDANHFEDPPAGAGEFLGYSSVANKRTVCGNCHIGKQKQWERTAHASAWETLEQSGAARELCEACHSVSSLGNLVTQQSVGWVATKNARYKDVQCEACHGPGLTHVTNPDATGTKPLAPLAVGTGLTRGCGECHSGAHRPFAEEWSDSKHARVVDSRSTNPSCNGCHEAKAILQGWGIKSTFLEEAETGHMAVTCAVCHDPHDARHKGQLRFAMDVPSVEHNLCMKCHHKRGAPEIATPQRGPHSPEGPLLLGEAGWIPPNFAYPPGALVGSHGSDANPRLCATCHVNDYQVTDKLTGGFSFRATGHSFQAIPCVDAAGVPTGAANCELTQRSFRSCTGCHLSEQAARTALTVSEMRIERLVAELGGLLARVPAAEFNNNDNIYTTGEGARFNMQLGQKKGSVAHNPFLLEALLIASIKQIEIDYGLRPSATLSLEPTLAPQ